MKAPKRPKKSYIENIEQLKVLMISLLRKSLIPIFQI